MACFRCQDAPFRAQLWVNFRGSCGESCEESTDESKHTYIPRMRKSNNTIIAFSHGSEVGEDVGAIEEVTEVVAPIHVSAWAVSTRGGWAKQRLVWKPGDVIVYCQQQI